MLKVTIILTNSQTKKFITADPGEDLENLLVRLRTNNAAGTTTANTPHNTDLATTPPNSNHATATTKLPTSACPTTTHMGVLTGLAALTAAICSGVKGAKSVASSSNSESCQPAGAIVAIKITLTLQLGRVQISLRLYVETQP